MWTRIKSNLESGTEKLKWFSSMFSDRLKIELSVMKLLYESDCLEKKKNDMMKTIGKRIWELQGQPERNILKDTIIMDALSEIERINSDIDATKKKASDISGS
jgi:predicted transcriptional regulator